MVSIAPVDSPSNLPYSTNANPIPPAIDSTWPLTFEDHFYETGVDWSVWQDGGKNFTNGGNGELQQYVPSACTAEDSVLKIGANRASAKGRAYTSGELNTRSTFKQAYGYFEFRGRLPQGQGLWPAFWLYDATGETPQEIDVMENLGKDSTTYYMTMHDNAGREAGHAYHGVDLSQEYHRYAVKWTPEAITFYLDDVQLYQVTSRIVSRPMAIFINLAVGGHWPGAPDRSTPFPADFYADYVRVWAMP
jgi:beta-glucanase (GH16 family)